MKKIIFVNATAATEGGILTILNQFTENIKNDGNVYYIFLSVENRKYLADNIIIIDKIKGKKKKDRIIWDVFGMKKWAKKNEIIPNLIISFQNTGVFFKGIRQIVYIHQALPYTNVVQWSILRKDERKYWFYKNVYKIWIDITVKNRAFVIVQTEWMKNKLLSRGYSESKILVSFPNINDIDVDKIKSHISDKKYFLYPAADYKYKNHKILIEAVKIIKNCNLHKDFKIILTLDNKSLVSKMINQNNVEEYFEFIGNVEYEKLLTYYKGCNAILFPSYIETIGLPLIEGSYFKKKILVSDCNYSREILKNYKYATFINYRNSREWANEIIKSLNIFNNNTDCNKLEFDNGWKDVMNLINMEIKDESSYNN